MAVLRDIPETTYPIGETIIGPDNIPGNINQYLLTVIQINWPNQGGKAFDYDCQVSLDGGDTWQSVSSGNVDDIIIPPKFGNPGGQFKIACTPPEQTQGIRKIRLVLNFVKEITFSIEVQGNQVSRMSQGQ